MGDRDDQAPEILAAITTVRFIKRGRVRKRRCLIWKPELYACGRRRNRVRWRC